MQKAKMKRQNDIAKLRKRFTKAFLHFELRIKNGNTAEGIGII